MHVVLHLAAIDKPFRRNISRSGACRISYLAYIKVFVGLARDRLNGLLASPSATSVAHMRALGLLAWIVTDNATWVLLHFAAFPGSDITYRLLWLFDPVVITVEAVQTASIYGAVRAFALAHAPAHKCMPWTMARLASAAYLVALMRCAAIGHCCCHLPAVGQAWKTNNYFALV